MVNNRIIYFKLGKNILILSIIIIYNNILSLIFMKKIDFL